MRTRVWLRRPDLTSGTDPDYRFSLANERTFLAWIRTALALVGGGLAIAGLLPTERPAVRDAVGLVLVLVGTAIAGASFARWARNEEAMRHGRPIPVSRLPLVLSLGVFVVAVLVVILLLSLS